MNQKSHSEFPEWDFSLKLLLISHYSTEIDAGKEPVKETTKLDKLALKTKTPAKAPVEKAVPVKKPDPAPVIVESESDPIQEVYFKNCTAVRAAGADPILRSEPGYAKHLDHDSDGIGCE